MKEEFVEKLTADFPAFFKNRWSIPDCGNGWFSIIYELCNQIKATNLPPDFEILQIKEKFGVLTVYLKNANSEIHDLTRLAEAKSSVICERCGQAGGKDHSGSYWIKTLCNSCIEYRKSGGRIWE